MMHFHITRMAGASSSSSGHIWSSASSRFGLTTTTALLLTRQQSFTPRPQVHHSTGGRRRMISTKKAKQLLGFSWSARPTVQELRTAYFEAAKQTHPDAVVARNHHHHHHHHHTTGDEDLEEEEVADTTTSAAADDFRKVTEAYERLLHSKELVITPFGDMIISKDEETQYRDACQNVLGIPAEIVEESKGNPMFRRWLTGNTDGAQHWRSFFAVHGGLAQKLRRPAAFLTSGVDPTDQEAALASRRPRRRR